MRHILFVDDEQHLLDGLRRMLRARRAEWEMTFLTSGEAGLEHLAHHPADVVVSDMRMPGMDGGAFLAAVRRAHPQTARMILSGHADRASIISAVGPTQQFLSKPCDADTLMAAVDRVLHLRDLVTDPTVRALIGGVESLPKPPAIYEQMIQLAADPECQVRDVVHLIEHDVATSAEVLHLINSSFFGLAARVDSVDRAVSLLGIETIQALAVAGAVFRSHDPVPTGLDQRALSDRGLAVGMISKKFALAEGWGRQGVSDAFFAGLLCDIGLPLMAHCRTDAWRTWRAHEALDPWELDARERETFGVSAHRAAAYLLGLWGFPQTIVEVVAGQPVTPADPLATPAAQLLTWVRRAVLDPTCAPPADGDGYFTPERLALVHRLRDEHVSASVARGAPTATDGAPQPTGSNQTAPNGGTRTVADAGRPYQGAASALTSPRLPTPEPPYRSASVLSTSRHVSANGNGSR